MQKFVAGSIVPLLVILGWSSLGTADRPPTLRGELRIVDKRTTNRFSVQHASIEFLVDVDANGALVPRLASKWYWQDDRTLVLSLRKGVTFHNGEIFDAGVVKLNWDMWKEYGAYWGKVYFFAFAPGSRLEILNTHTVKIVLPAPDAEALMKLRRGIANRQFFRTLEERARQSNKPRVKGYTIGRCALQAHGGAAHISLWKGLSARRRMCLKSS